MGYTVKKDVFNVYTVYPIIYGGKPYVVDVDLEVGFKFFIYNYEEKKKWLRGHKGECLFSGYLFETKIPNVPMLSNSKIDEDRFRTYLPQIMKTIFMNYKESECERKELEQKRADAEEWDGTVDV